MAFYEVTTILRHDLSKADVQKLIEEFSKIITDRKGTVVKEEYWGLRSLAYKINKNGKAHYQFLCLDTPYEGLAELERQMRINESVIRWLSVKVDEIEKGPSVMLQQDRSSEAA